MSDLRDLYQEVILDHNRNPRNFGKLEGANRSAEGYNPLCGDQMTLYLQVDDDGVIRDAAFEGNGCAISKSSSSLMTSEIKGKTVQDAETMFQRFHKMLTEDSDFEEDLETIGKLAVFAGVKEYPVRVKCATLSWHTLKGALENKQEPVTTE